jgi:NAD+ synthase
VAFSKDILKISPADEVQRIKSVLKEQVFRQLKRKGIVVAVSGGIDSSVTLALAARGLGSDRALALLMPEYESDPDSLRLGRLLAEKLHVDSVVEDIGPLLESAGCYRRRDDAIRMQVPEYGPGHKCKIVLSADTTQKGFNFFHLVISSPDGTQKKLRLDAPTYLGIVSATNMKQRARKFFEYYHADRLNFVVAGTPNRLEYDQGFFVKNGDGAADLKPIAHLYKSQVYQLAEYLEVPEEICRRPPTTDTYSMPQSQEEFYFPLPYEQMDLCLYGLNHGLPPAELSAAVGLTPEQVDSVYRQITSKRHATRYQHLKPLLIEDIEEPAKD